MEIVLVLHNIRSIHNVGSIFRTAEGFGVKKIYLSGYTPYPGVESGDKRLPHVVAKITKQIHKTALGAEKLVDFEYVPEITEVINRVSSEKYRLIGLEQDLRSTLLPDYCVKCVKNGPLRNVKVALILGEEVNGITPELRKSCDDLIEIPMYGKKESFNVSVATGIALYALVASRMDSGTSPE